MRQYGKKISNMFVYLVINIIKLYAFLISPLIGKNCRFVPTCSEYAVLAVKEYGIIRGCGMALVRIIKCNPFFSPKYDPVKSKKNKN